MPSKPFASRLPAPALWLAVALLALASAGCPMNRGDDDNYEKRPSDRWGADGTGGKSGKKDARKPPKDNAAKPPKNNAPKQRRGKDKPTKADDLEYRPSDLADRPAWNDPYRSYDPYDPYGPANRVDRPGYEPYGRPAGPYADPYGAPPPAAYRPPVSAAGRPDPAAEGLGIRVDPRSDMTPSPMTSTYTAPPARSPYGDYGPSSHAGSGPYGNASPYADPYAAPRSPYATPAPAPAPPPGPGGGYYPTPAPPLASDARPRGEEASPELEQARRLVLAKRYEEALPILERETQLRPHDAEAWRWTGDCLYNLLQFPKAIEAYHRARERGGGDYYALRGQGFAYLHLGHEYWRAQESARAAGDTARAGEAFRQAHEQYKNALGNLRECAKRNPKDEEACYGRGLAAEGASRRLFSVADAWLRSAEREPQPARQMEYRNNASQFAISFDEVVKDGLEAARLYSSMRPNDAAPLALAGGLLQRRAIMNHYLGRQAQAESDLQEAIAAQQRILDKIDQGNAIARAAVAECRRYLDGRWPERL